MGGIRQPEPHSNSPSFHQLRSAALSITKLSFLLSHSIGRITAQGPRGPNELTRMVATSVKWQRKVASRIFHSRRPLASGWVPGGGRGRERVLATARSEEIIADW